jgi:hypothetical protein
MKGLDAWITGHWGEDHPDNCEPEEEEVTQRLGRKKLKQLSKKYDLDFVRGDVEHNHTVTLTTRDGRVFTKYRDRLMEAGW